MYRRWKKCFGHKYYVTCDSAFDALSFTVPTYRNPTGGLLSGSKEDFNEVIGSPRVIIEHINGIIKGRFPILKSLPCLINEEEKTFDRVLKIIDVCVILHNFLIEENLNEDDPYWYVPTREPNENRYEYVPLAPDDELNRPAEGGGRRERLRGYLSEQGII